MDTLVSTLFVYHASPPVLSNLTKLPLSLGWVTWTALVLISALLSWSGVWVWGKLQKHPQQSYLATVEQVGGSRVGIVLVRIALTVYCFASLMQAASVLLRGWTGVAMMVEARTAQTVIFFTIISLLSIIGVCLFTLRLPKWGYRLLAIASLVGLTDFVLVKLIVLIKHPHWHQIHWLFASRVIMSMGKAWGIVTILSMGLLIPMALPEINVLWGQESHHCLNNWVAILPQAVYALVTLLTCYTGPNLNYPWWEYFSHLFYFVTMALMMIIVLSLVVRSLINPQRSPGADDDVERLGWNPKESSLTLPLLLSFSLLAFLWGLAQASLGRKKLLLMIGNYFHVLLGLPMGLLLMGGVPLWLWMQTGSKDRLGFAAVVFAASLSTASIIYLYAATIADHLK